MVKGICDVCRILDSDTTLKEVEYCSFCDAYICADDLHSTRRIKAWASKSGISIDKLKKFLHL